MRPTFARICVLQRAALCFTLAGLLTLAGCGDGKIARYPAKGTVTIDGSPAEGAMVMLCPIDPGPELKDLRPSGMTDAQGVYQLTTIDSRDGAPAGQYKVLVKWPAPPPPGAQDRDGRGPRPGPDRLKGKYYNLDSTPLSVTIEKKSNELPLELSSK